LVNIKSYKDLIAWQKSIALVTDVYSFTKRFPSDERFGLISQINRSSISIPANIAEGWGRQTLKNNLQFLRSARGSLMELQTYFEICKNVSLITLDEYQRLFDCSEEVSRILQGLINNIVKQIKDKELVS
jgi:four helix bundle protein